MVVIYALCDPETNQVRYVGKAKNIPKRLTAHRNEKGTTKKCRWLASLFNRNLEPKIRELEQVSEDYWQEAEIKWIAHFREAGCDLCNHTSGGEGLNSPSDETRKKMSDIQKARMRDPVYLAKVFTPERSAKISASLKGKEKSPEHIAKLRQNQPGREISEEHKAKISGAANKGHRWNKEEVAKIREMNRGNKYGLGNKSNTGRKLSEEQKSKISRAGKGKKKSPEHREKIRQAAIRRWAKQRGTKNEVQPTLFNENNGAI